MRAACNVGESFVDRDPVDQRREVVQYPDRGVAEPLVLLEVPGDEDQVGAKRSRPPTGPLRGENSPAEVGQGLVRDVDPKRLDGWVFP